MNLSKDNRILRKLFWSILPVQAIAIGLPAINSLIDGFIVGNYYGAKNLAAIGFFDPAMMYISAIGSMLGAGSQLLCGQCLGEGDEKGIRRIYSSTIFMCIIFGLSFALFSYLAPDTMTGMLGCSGESVAITSDYVKGMGWGLFASILVSCILPFLQFEQLGIMCSVSAIAMMAVNFIGDLAEVYYFKTGMLGIGLASSAASITALLISLSVLIVKTKVFKFSLRAIDLKTCGDICYIGVPSALQSFLLIGRNRVINHYVFSLGGVVGMSAMAIGNNITKATGCVVEAGYNGAGRIISSVLVGERDVESLRKLPKLMIQNSSILYIAMYAVVFFFAKPLALLFGAPIEDIIVYVWAIRIYNLWFFTNIFKVPSFSIYQSMGWVKLICIVVFLNIVGYPVPLCMLFGNALGFYFVMLTTVIADALVTPTFAVIYTIITKKLPKSIFEITYVPDSLAVEKENRFEATVQSVEEAVELSENLQDFCMEKGLSEREAIYCGLCIEEMTVDAINNRFPNNKYTVDVRAIYEDDKMHILFRDNCPHFNPNEWLELCTPEDQSRSIGIKMVKAMASEMNYSSTLGLNVLNITI